jgi:hypothetical protein
MLENLNTNPSKKPCAVRTLWQSLDEADREILLKNVGDYTLPVKRLEKALREVGVMLSDTAIARHRESHCSCSKI